MIELKLHLSERDKKLGGVCGGIAETVNIDPSIIRIIAVFLLLVFNWVAFFVYIVMWAVLPRE